MRSLLPFALALFAGAVSGYLAWASNEMLPVIGSLLIFGFAFGVWKVRVGWICSIVVALGVPAFYLISEALGLPSRWPPQPNISATFIALIPAVLGAAVGSGFRWALDQVSTREAA